MKISTLLVLIMGLVINTSAAAQALRIDGPFSDRIHHTQIKAELDTHSHKVTASMTLRWRNTTGVEITEIPFHLYLNAFSATDTTFMLESNGGQLRSDKREGDKQEDFGYVRVTSLQAENGDDWLPNWHDDIDIAQLKLPTPLQPNEELVIHMTFVSQLPKVFARSGHNGDTFNFVAQWFPKPGVYKDGAWVNHRYHAHSEFFADFGEYDVELVVPKDFKVGATGYLQEVKEQGDNYHHFYRAEDVHDFVWTADSKFKEAMRNWNGVDIRLLYQPPLDDKSIENQFDAAVASFEWFEKVVGAYPYSTMTLVQPPKNAGGAGGMEYPTLVTTITNLDYKSYQQAAAMVTIHEIGHNYWQGIFASNEFEESWMDEGINSYTEGRIMAETLGRPNVAELANFAIDMPTAHHIGTASLPALDPVKTASWAFASSRSYSVNSYSKPATILNTVERLWGRDKVDQTMKNYYQQWAFKHPTTADFIAVAHAVDSEMAAFLDAAINTTKTIDLSVYSVKSGKSQQHGGYRFSAANEPEFVSPTEGEDYSHTITLTRQGELLPPAIDVRLVYADGSVENRQWQLDPTVAWQKWQWQSANELVSVTVDPEFKVLLDKNFANNTKMRGEKSHQAWRWVMALVQTIQNTFTLFLPL